MEAGKVLWFNDLKGYGFIQSNDGQEIYFHYTAIAESGAEKQQVPAGTKVHFDLFQTTSGPEAANIKIAR